MMVIATIPLFNALGVVCLESFRGGAREAQSASCPASCTTR